METFTVLPRDLEDLGVGFLFLQSFIQKPEDVEKVEIQNSADVFVCTISGDPEEKRNYRYFRQWRLGGNIQKLSGDVDFSKVQGIQVTFNEIIEAVFLASGGYVCDGKVNVGYDFEAREGRFSLKIEKNLG